MNGMRELAGVRDHREPPRRLLVGRVVMRHRRVRADAGSTFSSISPRLTLTGFRRCHLVAREQPGVGVRQEPGGERDLARLVDVLDRRRVAELGEAGAIGGEGRLGLVAEAHERLDAALLVRALEPRADLLAAHRPRAGIVGVLRNVQ